MPMYCKLAFGNVKKSIRDYAIYFLTLLFGVCVFYAFNAIAQQGAVLDLSGAQNQMIILLGMLVTGVSVFIAVVLGFLIVYANRFLIRRRKREFGIYLTLGMERSKVSRIIVLETLFVGLLSLVCGLALGVALSQVMLYATAALFKVTIDTFTFSFSGTACLMTVGCFALIFLTTLVFNVMAVSRYKLIDLINADKTSETVKIRSLPLSVLLFVLSLGLLGAAYYLLLKNGLTVMNEQFAASTALMLVGTFLFFFSLSGFLLRVVQGNKKLYLRGLNTFTLRQLNSKINTAFLSISLVCVALFLAITSTCGGFAICTAMNKSLASSTVYDASLSTYNYSLEMHDDGPQVQQDPASLADGGDMHAALVRDVVGYDEIVRADAQVDVYATHLTMRDLIDRTNSELGTAYNMENMDKTPMPMSSVSQLNGLRELTGLPPVQLNEGEYLIWCDFIDMQNFYRSFIQQNDTLEVGGRTLHPQSDTIDTTAAEVSSFPMNTGIVVVNDSDLPADAVVWYSNLDIMYNEERSLADGMFNEALDAAYGPECLSYGQTPGWPFMRGMTALFAIDQSSGLTTVISYLAIYIGFILLITCAAILALQQLSEAADNRHRYTILEKIGAEQRMVNTALFTQIGIYFLFPLALAVVHSAVALKVVTDVVRMFGLLDIVGPLLITVAFAVVIYGGYFLVTYFAARGMILSKTKR